MNNTNPYYKIVTDPLALARELYAYGLELPMLPRLLKFIPPDTLCLERIGGSSYLDLWQDDTPSILGDVIARFHQATYNGSEALCHWDNQPQNILLAEGVIYLVDFGDSRFAPPMADVTHLLLFWVAQMKFKSFTRAINRFLKSYHQILPLRTEHWRNHLQDSIQRFDQRRKLYCPHLLSDNPDTDMNRSYLQHISFGSALLDE